MKCEIRITGQIGGNHRLLSALNNGDYKRGMFNSFTIPFETIGEAIKAMSEGWKSIKNIDDNHSWHDGLSKDRKVLYYDASKAEIITKED